MEKTEKTYDGSIGDLAKHLITDLLKTAQKDAIGDSPLDKIIKHVKYGGADATMASISAFSAYVHAKAVERQADAMESLAKTANKIQIAEQIDDAAQAIVDDREPKREYLAATYSLPSDTLTLLWGLRGMLVDASIRSLSKPDRFDPYRQLSTDEIAWALRMTPEEFYDRLPHTENGIDFSLLQEYDCLHYGGTNERPDQWMYGG